MITLFFDGLTAAVKTLDRLLTAAEGARRPVGPPTVDDARPAGTGPRPGVGGHPIRSTSELLTHAHDVIVDIFDLDKNGGYGPCFMLVRDLADRAAQLQAEGD